MNLDWIETVWIRFPFSFFVLNVAMVVYKIVEASDGRKKIVFSIKLLKRCILIFFSFFNLFLRMIFEEIQFKNI